MAATNGPKRTSSRQTDYRLRLWLLAALLVVLSVLCYGIVRKPSPDSFNRPEAQVPNRLRSPWGVPNPL